MANTSVPTLFLNEPAGFSGPVSFNYTTPFPYKPGTKARDTQGNEYVFVDFTASVYLGVLVAITPDYFATPLLGTSLLPQRIGVSMTDSSSDNGGWVQIYGLNVAVQTGAVSDGQVSDQTVGYQLSPQTSVGTPSGVLFMVAGTVTDNLNVIFGMWLTILGVSDLNVTVDDVSTSTGNANVSAASDSSGPTTYWANVTDGTAKRIGNTYPVFLNYPYVTGQLIDVMASQC